ncbi:MAG: DNA double-strand break repair ATPase Rad50 [Thermococcus sp.]|nr:DNA double-strand break repair ATPase Rad50 [Thermococcus sp.]
MRLKRVEIRNFRSHANSVVEFNSGINLIIGQNGAGKSSILEAVFAALYLGHPSFPRGYRQVNVRIGASSMELRMEFEHEGKNYTIVRKDGESYLKEDGRIIAEKESEIARWVEKNIFPLHVYRNALYIRQGEIETIITDEETRNRLLRKVLGIEDLEMAEENVKETLREIKRRKAEKENLAGREREIKDGIVEYEGKLKSTMEEITELRDELSRARKELRALEKEYTRLKSLKEEIVRLEKALVEKEKQAEGIQELIRNYEKQIEDLKKELDELKGKEKRLKELEGPAKEYERLRELLKREDELNSVKLERERLREREKHLREETGREDEIRKKLEELKTEYRKLNEELKLLKKSADEYDRVKRLLGEREKYLDELRRAGLTREELKERLEELDYAKNELESVREEIVRVKNELSELIGRENSLQENLRRLEGAKICPLCRRPIEEHDEDKIRGEYSREFEGIKKMKGELERRLKEFEERKKKLEAVLKDEKRLLTLSKVLSLLEDVEKRLEGTDPEKLKGEAEKFEETSKRVVELRRDILNLQEELDKLEGVRKELEKIQKKLESLSRKEVDITAEIRKNGFSSFEEIKGRLSELEKPYREYLSLKDVPRKVEITERRVSKIEEIKSAKGRELEGVRKELLELREKAQELSNEFSEEAFEETERKYRSLLEKVAGLEKSVEGREKLLEEVKKHLEELKARLKEIEEAKRELGVLEKLEKELNVLKDKITKFKAEEEVRGLAEVERIAGETFSEMTEGKYQGIKIIREKKFKKERLLIKVLYQGREVDVDFLSGGERIALGLAFRLALSLYKVRNMELLILDEPTPFLDEERRRKLIEIISQHLRKIPQVVIVSHDEELKDAADYVIRVTQVGGRSRVEVESVGAY